MKNKLSYDIFLIVLTGALLLGYGAGAMLNFGDTVSENENRNLASLTGMTLENFSDGSFFESASNFYSDRFPNRVALTRIKAITELALGKMGNNGVILGKDGYLIAEREYGDFDVLEKNLEFFSLLEILCQDRGIPFLCAVAPGSIDVNTGYLPDSYRGNANEVWCFLEEKQIVKIVTLNDAFNCGENYLWYKTDHHWTTDGAYEAYKYIAEKMKIDAKDKSCFFIETVADDFYGTTYSKSGNIPVKPDNIRLYRYNGDEDFTVKITESQESFSGFYCDEKLNTKDKYGVFLGGNFAELTVKKEADEPRENLLLIKDSFANSVIPFLAIHYDLTVIDERYYTGDIAKHLENADGVLLLHGIDTLASTPLK